MIIPDLHEFPAARFPTAYGFPLPIFRDRKPGIGMLPEGTVLRAVGWLGDDVPCPGETPAECIDLLLAAYANKGVFSDGTMGWHTCEICTIRDGHDPISKIRPVVHWNGRDVQLYGHGQYLIRNHNVVYMAPALIAHYIVDHRYRPPDEFIDAVRFGSFMTKEDLVFFPRDRW